MCTVLFAGQKLNCHPHQQIGNLNLVLRISLVAKTSHLYVLLLIANFGSWLFVFAMNRPTDSGASKYITYSNILVFYP